MEILKINNNVLIINLIYLLIVYILYVELKITGPLNNHIFKTFSLERGDLYRTEM